VKSRMAHIAAALIAIALTASGCQGVRWEQYINGGQPTATPRAPHVTATPTPDVRPTVVPVELVPPEVEQFAHEWPMANRSYDNARTTFDSEINSENVSELGVAWTIAIPGVGSWGSAASNPLIADGIIYFQDLMTNVYAINLEDGTPIWQKLYGQSVLGPNGPALGWGKIFIEGGVNTVIALDMETGEELWETVPLEGPGGSYQPHVYGGYVFAGVGAGAIEQTADEVTARRGYGGGTSGHIYAIDQSNGNILWSFQTVTEDFWGNPEVNSGGGIWFPPAIDSENNLTFWSTGNPAPFPGTLEYPNAASRPGPNLYSNTMLALELDTGDLIWYDQVLPRDLFDLDFQLSPILAEAQIDGQERQIVIGSGKLGRVYAFDRITGERYWETEVGIHQNDLLQEIPMGEEVEVYPGVWGGVETPMALAEGVVYMMVANLPTPYTATGWDAHNGQEAVSNAEGRTQLDNGTAEFVAIDINTGEILWSTEFDRVGFAAATVVNDLVFTATLDGMIYALNREDGEVAWTFQAPGGIIAWPAVAGDSIVWPVGLGRDPVLMTLRIGAGGDVQTPATHPTQTPEAEDSPIQTPLVPPMIEPTPAQPES
jgi:outer membrane protein assembly factor BamB